MADCVPFKLYVGDQIGDVVSVLVRELRGKGAIVNGDTESGSISLSLPIGGRIRCHYQRTGNSIEVNISDRPDAVSCGSIESKLQDFILDAKALLKNRPES